MSEIVYERYFLEKIFERETKYIVLVIFKKYIIK